MLEEVNHCPICNGKAFHEELICQDNTSSNEKFKIVSCETCKLFLTSPRPDEKSIGKYYESTSYISHSKESKSLFDKLYFSIRKISFKNKKNLIEKYTMQGKLLDIGCGTGQFIKYLSKNDWKTFGIEPTIKAYKISSEENRNVFRNFEELKETEFETITMWHVLEHIHKIDETLQNIFHHIAQNGTLFIAVPNHESFDAKHYGTKWAAYDVPRHLWHFNQKNIKQLLEKHHFKLISTEPMKFDSFYVSLLSERNIQKKRNPIVVAVKAFILGFISNIKGSFSGNYSSLIYIAKKS